MFITVVAVLAVLCAAIVDAADLSGYWSDNDLKRVQETAKAICHTSQSNREIYHGLQLLKKFGDAKDVCNCENISSAARGARSVMDWYFVVSNNELCQCSVNAPADILEGIQANLSVSVCHNVPILTCMIEYLFPG